ncbi:dihydroneopterin aldolase [Sphingomonas lutea]|uniref:dihydroneopterin aldolase n=1 Tax=Sphingomonas lutea TaxID=1045317 RepID=A0A7G9SKL6_9SPHN|nr:dihydroneopterin aldolase [Sphingomonas lutea]QNN68391.1 dihydroneopterin aldolase [Sphingomonas lutea]
MADDDARLSGMVPDHLQVRSARIILDSLALDADIGFHDFEIGNPQRLLATVEIWLDDATAPANDDPAGAWDYDFVRSQVREIAMLRRYNLQETLAHAIFDRLAALHGIRDLRVRLSKPDIYSDARGVGVEIASFHAAWPNR